MGLEVGLVERGDGFGSFYWADDNKYEGFWKNDNAND